MKIIHKERSSEGSVSKKHRKEETQSPNTSILKKSPTKSNIRSNANDAALNDLFAVSLQQRKKIPWSRTHPHAPKKKEKLMKATPKRPNKIPSTVLMKNIARIHEDMETDSKSKTQCPYCHESLTIDSKDINNADDQLPATLPPILQLELDKINVAEKKYHEERKGQKHLDDLPKRRFVSNMDQFRFCQLHILELKVKPEGIRLGYPIDLDFTELGKRVESLRPELERVINGKIDSTYRNIALAAYKDMGLHKARNTMGVLARFEKTLPGYYGPKGASIIMSKLNDILLHTGFLTKDKTYPQLPLEYIQQVLVPEAGWRLIQEDLIKKGCYDDINMHGADQMKEKAMETMTYSVDFGIKMYSEESAYPAQHNENDSGDDKDNGSAGDDYDEPTEIFECLSSDEEQE
ncbi:hypothetical protein BCR42DRAFT_403336 [Absidia repens]|uniref:Restriction of telomere capping protein 4 n=1 Tax=Absidia repens TaxID=90262 RepID=A0A1X2IZA8_9FUNG|nr:hypothetical protein BCR42DRAFT_403336 [Absidia repens]